MHVPLSLLSSCSHLSIFHYNVHSNWCIWCFIVLVLAVVVGVIIIIVIIVRLTVVSGRRVKLCEVMTTQKCSPHCGLHFEAISSEGCQAGNDEKHFIVMWLQT